MIDTLGILPSTEHCRSQRIIRLYDDDKVWQFDEARRVMGGISVDDQVLDF